MTHPPAGPSTPPPPPGPRAVPSAAELAGARSTSAAPMTGTRRLSAYVQQSNRASFTPRQWRRYVHKANRSTAGAA